MGVSVEEWSSASHEHRAAHNAMTATVFIAIAAATASKTMCERVPSRVDESPLTERADEHLVCRFNVHLEAALMLLTRKAFSSRQVCQGHNEWNQRKGAKAEPVQGQCTHPLLQSRKQRELQHDAEDA